MENYIFITIIKYANKRKYYIYREKEKNDKFHIFFKKNKKFFDVDDAMYQKLAKNYFKCEELLCSKKSFRIKLLSFGLATFVTITFISGINILNKKKVILTTDTYGGKTPIPISSILEGFDNDQTQTSNMQVEYDNHINSLAPEIIDKSIKDEIISATIIEEKSPQEDDFNSLNYEQRVNYVKNNINEIIIKFNLNEFELINKTYFQEMLVEIIATDLKLWNYLSTNLPVLDNNKIINTIISAYETDTYKLSKQAKIDYYLDISRLSEYPGIKEFDIETLWEFVSINYPRLNNHEQSFQLFAYFIENDNISTDEIPQIISRFKLEEYEKYIYQNPILFLNFYSSIMKNINLSSEDSLYLLTFIDYFIINEDVINIENIFNKLKYLKITYYETGDRDSILGDCTVLFDSISQEDIPCVRIYHTLTRSEKQIEQTKAHEFFHVFSLKTENSGIKHFVFKDGKCRVLDYIANENEYEFEINSSSYFHETLTELLAADWKKEGVVSAYATQSFYGRALGYIIGDDILIKAHHDDSGQAIIFNHLLDLGISKELLRDMWSRLMILHNDVNTNELDLLQYQLLEDIVLIYKTIKNENWQNDFEFTLLILNCLRGINLNNIPEYLVDGDYNMRIPDFYNSLKNLDITKLFPEVLEPYIDEYYLVTFHLYNISSFNPQIKEGTLLFNLASKENPVAGFHCTLTGTIVNNSFKINTCISEEYGPQNLNSQASLGR